MRQWREVHGLNGQMRSAELGRPPLFHQERRWKDFHLAAARVSSPGRSELLQLKATPSDDGLRLFSFPVWLVPLGSFVHFTGEPFKHFHFPAGFFMIWAFCQDLQFWFEPMCKKTGGLRGNNNNNNLLEKNKGLTVQQKLT